MIDMTSLVLQRHGCKKGEGAMEILFTRCADALPSSPSFGPLTEDLRRVLRTELLRDSCSAATVARLFSMHRRTLNRHLRTEGLAFRQVANEIRFELACELLENTDMALGQVAAALKYSELSAFTRAFRRWSGQAPSAWRSSHPRARKPRLLRKPRRGPDPA
jgi:AraC-like DNA-binding protein